MQDGTPLGDIDLLAAEHGVDAPPQAGFFRQLQKQLHGFVGDTVFGIVEADARGLDGQAPGALWIAGEELAQMQVPDLLVVGLEGLPGRETGQRLVGGCHVPPFTV